MPVWCDHRDGESADGDLTVYAIDSTSEEACQGTFEGGVCKDNWMGVARWPPR
jgi:hypothetical protein